MGFTLPIFRRCCCCCSLRAGSLIIGYLSVLASALYVAAACASLITIVKFVQREKLHPDHNLRPDAVASAAIWLYIIHSLIIGYYLITILVNVLLVFGVHSNRTSFLRLYVNFCVFLLVAEIVLFVLSSIFIGVSSLLPMLGWAVILLYFLLVVRSTYLDMEEKSRRRVYEMQRVPQTPLVSSYPHQV